MRIMIIGAGEIGRHLAKRLSSEAHQIVVIESNEALAAELSKGLDARVVHGDGASIGVLLDSGVTDCELFVALTTSNETNLVSCALAKSLGAQKAICRVHPNMERETAFFDFKERFLIDYLFSSERLAAIDLFKYIRNPDSRFVEEIARGLIELQQVVVPDRSVYLGKPLREMKLPDRVRVGAIEREGKFVVPSGDEEFRIGDVLTMVGDPRRLHEVIGKIDKAFHRDAVRVVIFGGGEYGAALAQMLESWPCRVRILEADEERCAVLTERLGGTTILNVDATSLSELKEEQVGEADFFVATSSSDEDNVMTCLQAHSLGAKRCLTLIHRADYADAIGSFREHLGIVAAVSPREATAQELSRFVTSDRYHVVRRVGDAEVLEATVPPGSALDGVTVHEAGLPAHTQLVALLRGVQARVPAAGDRIEAGDHIYAMVGAEAKPAFLRLLASSRSGRPVRA
jgi:trk system potassium uptake protein TrkA